MVEGVKNTYQLSKILKRLVKFKLARNPQQKAVISSKGRQQAKELYSDRNPAATLHKKNPAADSKSAEESEKYLEFQKEVQARRLLKSDYQPKNPGKILKLPRKGMEHTESK